MRRTSLAGAQFKPPRRINTSVNTGLTGGEANDEGDVENDDNDEQRRIKRIKMSTEQEESQPVLMLTSFQMDAEAEARHLPSAPSTSIATILVKNVAEDINGGTSVASVAVASECVSTLSPPSPTPTSSLLCVDVDDSSTSGSSRTISPQPVPSEVLTRVARNTQASRHSFSIAQRREPETVDSLMAQKIQLEDRIKELEDDGNKAEDLDEYMELLHKYNNAKDIAQFVMGQLAIRDGITVRQVAEDIGAPVE